MSLRISVAVGALLVGMGAAHAADLYVAPPVVAAPAAAPAYWGVIELGGLGRLTTYDDDGVIEEGTFGGVYGSFALWGDLGVVRLGVDGYGEWLNAEDGAITNPHLGVLGAHAGVGLDAGYVGVFGAVASYTSSDEPDEGQFGYAGGIEGSIDVNIATLYGKLGYAHAPNEGGVDDEGFFGAFVEGGAIFSLSNEFAVQVSAGYGYSEPFETDDETGYYATWGIKGAYNLGTDLNINLVASYEGLYSAGLEDDESVLDHTFKLGLSVPFGGAGAASALNPLASPTAPFRASVHADVM